MKETLREAQHWAKIIELDHEYFGNTIVIIRLSYDDNGNESIIIESYIYNENEDSCYNIFEKIEVSERMLGLDIIENFSEDMTINFIERQAQALNLNPENN